MIVAIIAVVGGGGGGGGGALLDQVNAWRRDHFAKMEKKVGNREVSARRITPNDDDH